VTWPEEFLFGVFAIVLGTLVIATDQFAIVENRRLEGFRFFLIIGGVALIILIRGYVRAKDAPTRQDRLRQGGQVAWTTIREFGPLFLCLAFYEALHDLTPVLRPHTEDHYLVASDHFFLHVDVGVWLNDRIGSITMTRIMTLCYLSYAFASPIYAGVQYLRGRYREFHDFALAITVTALLGFIGYLVFPAVGPYVYQHDVYAHPLVGWNHGGILDVISRMKGDARDAFPSLHTAMTTVVLGMMWRDARRAFWCYLPVALGLYLSTMYLRVHYATDVAAGFVVGGLALYAAPKINRWWYAHRGSPAGLPRQRIAPNA
jgi:membrane-associated phospholipid phosphatase